MSPVTDFLIVVPVFEINYIATNLQFFQTLHINVALKQKKFRLLKAIFRRTVLLNKS